MSLPHEGCHQEGCFGKVAKAVKLKTSEPVALKILKTEAAAKREIQMLEVVSVLDPVKKNVVQFLEKFQHRGHTCLVFEMLDRSLHQLLVELNRPLSLSEIRPVTHQLLMAFDALKGIGVVHANLKPDNIMLVNHPAEPFRVKLVDFGVSFNTSEERQGMIIQPLGCRAPEVFLGLPVSEAIDMWGLGCVLGFVYLRKKLFASHCVYQSIRGIVDILGQPADHLLSAGKHTHTFFKANQHWDKPRWWMKTPREYQIGTGIEPKRWHMRLRNLDDLITHDPRTQENIELEDQRAFVNLLKCLLNTDAEKRITPGKALTHPFVTMAHLVDEVEISLYAKNSSKKMAVVPTDNFDEDLSPNGEAEGEPNDEEPSATAHFNDAAVPRSCDSMPRSSDGAEAAAEIEDIFFTALEEPAVCQVAASPADGEAQERPKDEEPSATPPKNDAGSAVPRSCGSVEKMLHSSDGAEAAAGIDAAGSAVSQGVASPAEETSADGGSPDECPPAKDKKSRLKRIRKFFGRTIRTLFGKKRND
ncbi:homeodomain-interacting protein kinase 1-like [Xiphias gladius]|uniref:homeodomain-interacting protein kinase 1-like n=1 Tax=Xiphias gladius TaxID=8245 RepID=UPI001A982DDA|nr:homeodomain-interacting protein kinase 1-like [Xiphias gladius]